MPRPQTTSSQILRTNADDPNALAPAITPTGAAETSVARMAGGKADTRS